MRKTNNSKPCGNLSGFCLTIEQNWISKKLFRDKFESPISSVEFYFVSDFHNNFKARLYLIFLYNNFSKLLVWFRQYNPYICILLLQFWKLARQLFSECGNVRGIIFLILKVVGMQFLNSPYLNQATAASVLMKPVAEKFTCKGLIRELKFWESNVLLDDFQNQSVGYPERPTDKQLDLIG